MLFIRTAVMVLLFILTLVGGIASGSADTPQKDPSSTGRRLYPFTAGYYSRSTLVEGIYFDKTLGCVTFYRALTHSLPKPSYSCEYTAKEGRRLIEIKLNDGCLPLIRDSRGRYDRTLLTGMRVKLDYSELTVPETGGKVETYHEIW